MEVITTTCRSSIKNHMKSFYFICVLFSVSLTTMVLSKNKADNEIPISRKLKQVLNDKKIILLWIPTNCKDCAPFGKFQHGNLLFKSSNCKYQNCYVDSNQNRVLEEDQYDAIIFNGRPILRMTPEDLPQKRDPTQRYIFLQRESDYRFPVCQDYYDDFFNWTITYRFDSDFPWPYFTIKNLSNETIGPRADMVWDEIMMPISNDLERKLANKTKLVAWFVSNCYDKKGRMDFARNLRRELQRYNETLDIYGRCGRLKCPRSEADKCNKYIENDYKFYLAFENSFAEDYVTEKLLTAVQHNAVPIVYGGADYDRFLPPKSYIDGRLLGPKRLAEVMIDAATNSTIYNSFFKWRNYYSYDAYIHGEFACRLCTRLNEDDMPSQYQDFRRWWSKDYERRCET